MNAESRSKTMRNRGGLFLRFILPLLALTLIVGMISLLLAIKDEQKRNLERLASIASSNSQLTQRLELPSSAQLASELSTTSGVTIVFSGPDQELISSTPLSEPQQAAVRQALKETPKAIQLDGFDAAASSLSARPAESLIALQPTQHTGLFHHRDAATLSLVGGVVLALGAAFLISRSVVKPLEKVVDHVQDTQNDQPLTFSSSLVNRRDEIGTLTRALSSSRAQLLEEQQKRERAERLALLGQLTTSLAHEIKNPAASIIMHAQALEKYENNPAGPLIKEEGERIVSLVDQWLFVAKPEGPRHAINDLSKLLRTLLEKLAPLFDFHQIDLNITLPDHLPFNCDAQRIEHVFRNLIDNAIHAMPSGGPLTLTLSEDDEHIHFTVSDQGTGFSDQALSHFGEAFYSEREGGLGLGLTLVCGVIQAHGGTVQAENAPSGGAQVRGQLPKHTTSLQA